MSPFIAAIKRRIAIHNLPASPGKRILLTFDDGPHATRTPRMLDILKEFDVRAVFFVVGNRVGPEASVIRRILDEGHVLGNHSQNHIRVRSPIKAFQEVEFCQREVIKTSGYRPSLYRPPYGQLSSTAVPYAKLAGLRCVLWSIDPEDFKIDSSQAAAQAGIRLAEELNRPQRRSEIVLLHDESPHTGVLVESLLNNLAACDLQSGAAALVGRKP